MFMGENVISVILLKEREKNKREREGHRERERERENDMLAYARMFSN